MRSNKDGEEVDEGQETTKLNNFEDILELIGTKGRWHINIFFLCCAQMIPCPFSAISYQFLGATPDHWCHVAPLVDANWTREEILQLAIPFSNDTGTYDRCTMYNANYTLASTLGFHESLNNPEVNPTLSGAETVPCGTWDFDHTEYKSTVVTDWDLVCERRPLYSSVQAMAQAGLLLGSFVMGYLSDRYGRRTVAVLSTFLILIIGIAMSLIPVFEVYIILRLLFCVMIMGIYVGTFVLLLEVSTPKMRSMSAIIFILPWTVGYMILPGIAYLVRSWQYLQAVLVMPYIPLLSYYWLLPESPRWLIQQGRHDEALLVLSKAAKLNRRTMPPKAEMIAAMETIQKKLSEEESQGNQERGGPIGVLKNIFVLIAKKELRVRTLAAFFCWFAVSIVYYGTALGATNLGVDMYLYMFLSGLLEVPAYLMLWPAIEHLGRRKTVASLFFICAISISSVAAIMFTSPNAPSTLKILLSQIGKLCVTAAFHLIWIYTAELFPTRYRSLAVGEGSCVARIGSVCSPYINDIMGEVTPWSPSALFASASLVASGLALLLPETKNREMMETGDAREESSERRPKT